MRWRALLTILTLVLLVVEIAIDPSTSFVRVHGGQSNAVVGVASDTGTTVERGYGSEYQGHDYRVAAMAHACCGAESVSAKIPVAESGPITALDVTGPGLIFSSIFQPPKI
ncbi:MAG: hypothetical protein ABL958_14580 [Bdellovibrionia bacterium]